MKHLISKLTLKFTVIFLLIFVFYSISFAQISKDKTPPKPANYSITEDEVLNRKGFVNDFAGILDRTAKGKLEQTLAKFKSHAKIDFVIVTVKTTGEDDIFDYSFSLANEWDVGAKNIDKAGILMLIAVNDRRWFIQVSRVMEDVLSDAEVGEFGALMRPLFQKKKYGEGIKTSVEKFIKVIKERRGENQSKSNNSKAVWRKQ